MKWNSDAKVCSCDQIILTDKFLIFCKNQHTLSSPIFLYLLPPPFPTVLFSFFDKFRLMLLRHRSIKRTWLVALRSSVLCTHIVQRSPWAFETCTTTIASPCRRHAWDPLQLIPRIPWSREHIRSKRRFDRSYLRTESYFSVHSRYSSLFKYLVA